MAGIYIHIPYCKKRCNYCDFYKTTNIDTKSGFLAALCAEIDERKDFFLHNEIHTIYFGGGTPSVLSSSELNRVFSCLGQYFDVSAVSEITVEVNPDDFTVEWGAGLKNSTPVNRLSFGLQSVFDQQLRVMGRRHNSVVGLDAIARAFDLGFENVTVDLIYGLPNLTLDMWEKTLDMVLSLPIKHLSSYHLTYEEGTPFFVDLKNGNLKEIDDALSLAQFEVLLDKVHAHGMYQYETSNFAVAGFESKHNSSYWTGESYIGFGPSAHSYWQNERRWNESNLAKYMKLSGSGCGYFGFEVLNATDRYNEILMLGLRTSRGVLIENIRNVGADYYNHFLSSIAPLLEVGELKLEDDFLFVPVSHRFIADSIIQRLFLVDAI